MIYSPIACLAGLFGLNCWWQADFCEALGQIISALELAYNFLKIGTPYNFLKIGTPYNFLKIGAPYKILKIVTP